MNDDEQQDEELKAAGHSGQGLAVTLHSRLSWWQTLLLAFSVTHTLVNTLVNTLLWSIDTVPEVFWSIELNCTDISSALLHDSPLVLITWYQTTLHRR